MKNLKSLLTRPVPRWMMGVCGIIILACSFAAPAIIDEVNDLWGRPLVNRPARWSINGPKPSINSPWALDVRGYVRAVNDSGSANLVVGQDSAQLDWNGATLVKCTDSLLVATCESANMNGRYYFINGATNTALGVVGGGSFVHLNGDTIALRIVAKSTVAGVDTVYRIIAVKQ